MRSRGLGIQILAGISTDRCRDKCLVTTTVCTDGSNDLEDNCGKRLYELQNLLFSMNTALLKGIMCMDVFRVLVLVCSFELNPKPPADGELSSEQKQSFISAVEIAVRLLYIVVVTTR